MNSKLVLTSSASTLSAEDLAALFLGRVLAVTIPAFCTDKTCRLMSKRIAAHRRLAYYPHAPEIGRVMNAFYEGHADREIRSTYYNEVPQITREFRELSRPYLNPLEHLRLILEDVWPAGAQRENIHGRPMSFGLAQIFKEGASALPHQDFLKMDEPENSRAQTLLTQITAIIYVQPAKAGGKLELWHEHYEHNEFMARKNASTYGLDYKKIPKPGVSLSPGLGDLVMADSTKVHAVTPVTAGIRIAVNCFIGFRGIDEPLSFWS